MSTIQQALIMAVAAAGGGGGLTKVQNPTRTAQYFGKTVEQALTAVGSGNHLLIGLIAPTSAGEPAWSDSAGGSTAGTLAYSYASTTGSVTMYFYIRSNVTSGLTWIRGTWTPDVEAYINVVEVSGGTPVLDGSGNGAAQSSATQWDHAFTSTADDAMFMGLAAFSNGTTTTGVSPVQADCPASDWYANSSGLFTTAGSNTASFTIPDARSGHKAWICVKAS